MITDVLKDVLELNATSRKAKAGLGRDYIAAKTGIIIYAAPLNLGTFILVTNNIAIKAVAPKYTIWNIFSKYSGQLQWLNQIQNS